LLRQINRDFGLTIVLITHQMQVIKQVADRVAVLDGGRLVEQGAVIDVFTNPQHATTRSLIDEILPQELPASVIERIRRWVNTEPLHQGRLLRLAFSGDESNQPLLSDVSRRFGLDINILHGQVDDIQGQVFGSLAVHARGQSEQLNAAVTHLRHSGVRVVEEELSHG
jgi:D-methionine transport system ATP-binding protein